MLFKAFSILNRCQSLSLKSTFGVLKTVDKQLGVMAENEGLSDFGI